MKGRLAVLSPTFPPAVGGASIYYELLAKHLAAVEAVDEVVIYTERHPGVANTQTLADGRVVVRRLFPFRAGRADKPWTRHLAYAVQTVWFLCIAAWLKTQTRWLLVHASFHYHPTLLRLGLRLLLALRRSPPVLIVDVRDPKVPDDFAKRTDVYQRVIACGMNVVSRLAEVGIRAPRVVEIPVLMEPPSASEPRANELLRELGLAANGYVYSSNGINAEKGIDALVEMVRTLRHRGHDLCLAVAGRARDWTPVLRAAESEGLLRYVGVRSHAESVALAAKAALVVAIAEVESLSRSAVEAMWLGTPALLPPTVTEFQGSCDPFIVGNPAPQALADQVEQLLAHPELRPRYDFERHAPGRVVPQYIALLRELDHAATA